jgi:hypothetical protein
MTFNYIMFISELIKYFVFSFHKLIFQKSQYKTVYGPD